MALEQSWLPLKYRVALALIVVSVIFATVNALYHRQSTIPISVNYHFTRRCNKSCGFCFHTAKTSYILPIDEAKEGLSLLRLSGMKKINFAGGEPFLNRKFLVELVKFCKETLALESVSIVTNGSLVTEEFLTKYGSYIDILAFSCDSFDENTNKDIGRGYEHQIDKLHKISNWCKRFGIKFKLNTVICRQNFMEDMNNVLEKLRPFRWKCFQVLTVQGENDSEETIRDVRRFSISLKEFNLFCDRHRHQPSFVPEPNHLMAKYYLILDEYMRFLDRTGRQPSESILKVGVSKALASVYWDQTSFKERGGIYDWAKSPSTEGCASGDNSELQW